MADETPPGIDLIADGVRLFNERYFFEAHEVLEGAWREERGESRLFLQGLIQICAAYHHYQNGNLVGAATLLHRGADKLRGYPHRYQGIDVRSLLEGVNSDRERIERMQSDRTSGEPIDFPKIERELRG